MPEYIEREANKRYFDIDEFAQSICENPTFTEDEANKFIYLLRSFPTADVQEVRHGRNETNLHPVDEFICSECGICFKDVSSYDIKEDVYKEFYFKLCPNCGAKMDKGE